MNTYSAIIENTASKHTGSMDEIVTRTNATLFVMYTAAFSVIGNPALTIITGPVMAAAMTLLFFTEKFYCVILLVILANDGLATVAMGKGSFYWLLIGLVLLKLITNRNEIIVSNKEIFHVTFVFLILMEFWLFNENSFRTVFQAFIFIVFLLLTWYEIKDNDEKIRDFYFQMALIIFIIALSSIAFGGVIMTEGEISRSGIVGIGSGDPNFSSLLINLGIAIMLVQKYRNRFVRFGMILVMVAAVIQTVSITGLLSLTAMLLVYGMAGVNLTKAVRNTTVLLVVAVLIIQVYQILPASLKSESMESYSVRIEMKMEAFSNKDYQQFTTYRSSRTQENLDYYSTQSTAKIILGGNGTPPSGIMLSHNTYVDLLIRFGLLGAIVFGVLIGHKTIKSFLDYYRTKNNGELFLIKILLLIYSGALSIYSGNEFALWYMFLIVL